MFHHIHLYFITSLTLYKTELSSFIFFEDFYVPNYSILDYEFFSPFVSVLSFFDQKINFPTSRMRNFIVDLLSNINHEIFFRHLLNPSILRVSSHDRQIKAVITNSAILFTPASSQEVESYKRQADFDSTLFFRQGILGLPRYPLL